MQDPCTRTGLYTDRVCVAHPWCCPDSSAPKVSKATQQCLVAEILKQLETVRGRNHVGDQAGLLTGTCKQVWVLGEAYGLGIVFLRLLLLYAEHVTRV